MSYDRFLDERLLTSRDALNRLQIKIKVLEIDENARDFSQRFGRRVLVQKVLLTIKHNETEEVEERELDVGDIENKMRKRRGFSVPRIAGLDQVISRTAMLLQVVISTCSPMRLPLIFTYLVLQKSSFERLSSYSMLGF